MAQKPSIPKGTRDFSPLEMARRNYIFDIIRKNFRLFGYKQIETPALENLSTLMGKYGDEGDKLLFKILNSGDFMKNVSEEDYERRHLPSLTQKMSEKGLRYDLTVPFARYVVMHRNDLQLPFKRYQIQPVWRADRPQKGRYREFYQCDADVVGSESLDNEVELLQLIDSVFQELGINIVIKFNNRKVLTGIAEVMGAADQIVDITVAIDKIDKIGIEKVNEELLEKGISPEGVEKLQPLLQMKGDNVEKINALENLLQNSEIARKGMEEVKYVLNTIKEVGLNCELEFDVSLARGLNYYTGTILEVKAKDVAIGSITGGGRYDNLTGVFGMSGLSGVGISFGADRIYDVMNQLDLYPDYITSSVAVLFLNMGKESREASLKCVKSLRQNDISAEYFPDNAKMKRQMTFANAENIPYVAMIGSEELEADKLTLKNMTDGSQERISISQFLERPQEFIK